MKGWEMTILADTNTRTAVFPWENTDVGDYLLPDSQVVKAEAMRTFLLYMVVESFDLTHEEQLWAEWVMDDVCGPLMVLQPVQVPVAVRQELLKGSYTRLLRKRSREKASKAIFDPSVKQATRDEWVAAILLPLTESYELHPLQELEIRTLIVGLLTDLGVGHPANPRGATYLPTELRQNVLAP